MIQLGWLTVAYEVLTKEAGVISTCSSFFDTLLTTEIVTTKDNCGMRFCIDVRQLKQTTALIKSVFAEAFDRRWMFRSLQVHVEARVYILR
jgi:hypothetical protein